MATTTVRRWGWLLLMALPLTDAAGAQRGLTLPPVGTVARWEAEQAAEIKGRTPLHRRPHASGGAFVEERGFSTRRSR